MECYPHSRPTEPNEAVAVEATKFWLSLSAAEVTRTKLNPEGRSGMSLPVLSKEAGEQIKVSIEVFFKVR